MKSLALAPLLAFVLGVALAATPAWAQSSPPMPPEPPRAEDPPPDAPPPDLSPEDGPPAPPAPVPPREAGRLVLQQVERPAPRPKPDPRKRINVDLEDASLADAMRGIGTSVGAAIRVAPEVKETITVTLREIPWREAVEVIAKITRCDVEERGEELLLTQPTRITLVLVEAPAGDALERIARSAGHRVVVPDHVRARRVTLDFKEVHWRHALEATLAAAAPEHHVVVDERAVVWFPKGPKPEPAPAPLADLPRAPYLSLDAQGIPIEDLVERIGQLTGRNVLVAPSIVERVTIRLEGVAWPEAILAIAARYGCRIERRGGVLLLTRPPRFEFQAAEAPLDPVFRLLAELAGKNLAASGLRGRAVSFTLRDRDPLDLLCRLAKNAGLSQRERAGLDLLVVHGPQREPPQAQPTPSGAPTSAPSRAAKKREGRLTTQAEALLARLARVADARDGDRLPQELEAVRLFLRKEGLTGVSAFKRALDRQDRGGRLYDVFEVIEVTLMLEEAGAWLRHMEALVAGGHYAAALQAGEELAAVTDTIENLVQYKGTQEVRARAKALLGTAKRLAPLESVPLELYATLGGSRPAAILGGRIVREGEQLRDGEGVPVEGCHLVQILPGEVRIRVGVTELRRRLRQSARAAPEEGRAGLGAGIVVLNNGAVFRGELLETRAAVALSWRDQRSGARGRQVFQRGFAPGRVRWVSAEGGLTEAYWSRYADLERYPLDARYRPETKRTR